MKRTVIFTVAVLFAVLASTLPARMNNTSRTLHPRAESTVAILFDGLIALAFGNSERVSAGFVNAHMHTPQVKIEKIQDGKRSTVAVLQADQLRQTLRFDVASGPQGIARFNVPGDENDFGWNLDMESDLYQRRLYLKDSAFFGKIHLSAGLWYSTNLTDQRVQFITEDGKMAAFDRKLGTPAAKINLADGDSFVISGGIQPLRLDTEPGIRYEIEITNLPPADLSDIRHFAHYFDVIGSRVTRYEPVVAKKAAYRPAPSMCESVVFSKSQIN